MISLFLVRIADVGEAWLGSRSVKAEIAVPNCSRCLLLFFKLLTTNGCADCFLAMLFARSG